MPWHQEPKKDVVSCLNREENLSGFRTAFRYNGLLTEQHGKV